MEPSVLVVDDEENLLVLLDRILGKEGYQVKTASNANEALKLLKRESFDAAIVDVRMYPIGGVALLGEIKRRSPSTRVMMITADPTTDCRDYCIKHGAADYRPKPLKIQELKSVIRQLVCA
jgi:DNA-binding NtrC family response regulator